MQPTPMKDQINSLIEPLQNRAIALATLISRIDMQLVRLDEILNDIQPPMTGKLRIEWYQSQGRRYPTPVVWKRARNGLWRAERVSVSNLSKRIRRSREFHDVAPVVRSLAKGIAAIIRQRQMAMEKFAVFNRSTGAMLESGTYHFEVAQNWVDHMRSLVPRKWGLKKAITSEASEQLAIARQSPL
jgi:hypothetical protein